ncbi:MAG: carboxypeptidase-like regulatory domain-containing protein [Sphingobacteriales bacterium]|nr:carboxypeptidase-like regulatory domain-containing protein [Sphingobacteriales bacterium]
MKRRVTGWLIVSWFFLQSSFILPPKGKITLVKGVVLSEKTGQPVKGALVYVVLGEEEALSKPNGDFTLETTKNTPFEVVTEHWEYQKNSLELKEAGQKLVIRLKPRQR